MVCRRAAPVRVRRSGGRRSGGRSRSWRSSPRPTAPASTAPRPPRRRRRRRCGATCFERGGARSRRMPCESRSRPADTPRASLLADTLQQPLPLYLWERQFDRTELTVRQIRTLFSDARYIHVLVWPVAQGRPGPRAIRRTPSRRRVRPGRPGSSAQGPSAPGCFSTMPWSMAWRSWALIHHGLLASPAMASSR